VSTADVVIVGAGPTGLLLACELALGGLHPVVLERLREPSSAPKANGLLGQIGQQLDYRGLLERLSVEAWFVGPLPQWGFGLVPLRLSTLPTSPLHAVLLQQPRIEALFTQHANELAVEIRRGHEVTALSHNDSHVSVEVRSPTGDYQLQTRYLVGCDGAGSRVRAMAGIEFPGSTSPETVLIGHFAAPDTPGLIDDPESVINGLAAGVTQTPQGRLMVTSLRPGIRLLAVTAADPHRGSAPVTVDEFRASVRRVLGHDVPIGEPIWLSRTMSHARLADTYRRGRVFLAGDAAHLLPGGGSALNVGLGDAFNLGWKLASHVNGQAPLTVLDTYHTERHPVAERALMHSRAQMLLLRSADEDVTAMRTLLTELLEFDQPLEHLGQVLEGSDIRYSMPGGGTHPLVGRLIPDLALETADKSQRVATLLRTGRPLLIDFTGTDNVRAAAQPWTQHIDVTPATCDQPPATALLIRPDGYVAWIDDQQANLHAALSHWFGPAGTRASAD
jgi:2-polyprenyl-6-methoxyphenol hydroxylase-like FAD-dependent oxidoreductase